ncbi:MAG: hypothetical protein ACRDRM_07110 [Pseudonocardiaceae bacterium]
MNATARDEIRDGMPASAGEAASLVESAMLLRWRAPELALLLADRAVAAAGKDRSTVVRADHLAVVALNRLGRHSEAAHRLLPALQADLPAAIMPTELRQELQVEMAHCAAALGEAPIALVALRPVLAAGEDVAPVLRGVALIAAAESSAALGRGEVVPSALEEADELFREDPHLDRDTALLLRATAKAVNAARLRRSGAAAECEAQARAGRELLIGLADPEHDSGQVSGRLMLETVLALLDRGEGDAAAHEARPMLRRPVRAAAAGAVGWLRLAIATRVHLAAGRHEPALALLADAVEVTQRHGADAVLAECLEGLSHVHEVRGEFADALHCLRSAHAAEARYRRTADTARSALSEHSGGARRAVAGLVDQIAALLPGTGPLRAVPDPDTGLLDAEEYDCRVEAALIGSAVHSQVLIAVGSGAADQPPGSGLLVALSKRLHKVAPAGAALGQITGDRIAVLLPATSRYQAQAWADRFRTDSAAALGADVTVGVAQYRAGTGIDQFLADTVLALRAATDATARAATARAATARAATADAVRADDPGIQAAPDQVTPDTVVLEVVPPTLGRPEVPAEIAAAPRSVDEGPFDDESERFPLGRPTEQPPPALPDDSLPEESAGSEPPGARRRRGTNGSQVLVSDLLPLSVLSAGRTGRRRAEGRPDGRPDGSVDSAENHSADRPADHVSTRPTDHSPDRADDHGADRAEGPSVAEARSSPTVLDTGVNGAAAAEGSGVVEHLSRELPVSGPPPAPMPRPLWGSNGAGHTGEPADVSMGDLLAGALAAYQESDHGDGTGPAGANNLEATPGRGPRGRRTPGIQLATDPVDRHPGNPRDAPTDPELRLPELTAEPPWRRPGTGRQSAAGE